MRLHVPLIQQHGRKWNHLIESMAINGKIVANAESERRADAAGGTILTIPDTVDIPLAPGEFKLFSMQTLPIRPAPDFKHTTTRIALEWIENHE